MAGPINNAQAVAVERERIHEALKPLFERSGKTHKLIKSKAALETVSNRALRIPLEIAPPGNARQVDLDGGDLGRGGGAQYIVATVSPLSFAVALEATKLAEIGTNSDSKAIADVVRKDMKNGMAELTWFLDALLQTPGTGQLSVATTISGTTWTLGGNWKTLLLHRGLRVQLYDSTFATQRTGTATIQAVNYEAGTITVDALPTGGVSTDLVVIEGLSGASPASLNGIPVFQSNATTGTTLGLTRSSYPEIQTPAFNASSTSVSPPMIRGVLNKLRIKRDDDEGMKSLVFHMNVHQEDAWEQNAQLISSIFKDPSASQGFEPFFDVKTMAGVPIKTNIKADPTRIDGLMLDRWGRSEMLPAGFYKDPGDGATVFGVYGASGGRASASLSYLAWSGQFWSSDPGYGCYIYTLTKPSIYA